LKLACLLGFVLLSSGCVRMGRAGLRPAAQLPAQSEVRNAVRLPDGDLDLERLRQRAIDDPSDTVARLQLAAHYDRLGMPELALEHYRLLGVRRPEDEHSHLRYAQSVRKTNPTEALRELREFATAYPVRLAETCSLLGILEDEGGDLAKGESWHREAIRREPKNDRWHNNLGFNLSQQSRQEDAVKSFRQALALNHQSDVARNNLAAALAENSRQLDQAFGLWRRASGSAQAHNNVGASHLRNGRLMAARKEFEEALRLSPGLPEAWRNLAKVAELDGQPAQWTSASPPAKGWRTVADGFRKVFTAGGTKPAVTEVAEGADSSGERIKKQKQAE
jgi:Flp pilus assembly protein TadD